jgi:hypothetical protein
MRPTWPGEDRADDYVFRVDGQDAGRGYVEVEDRVVARKAVGTEQARGFVDLGAFAVVVPRRFPVRKT